MSNKIRLIALNILVYGTPLLLWSQIPYTKNMWGSFSSDIIFNFLFYGSPKFSALGIIFDILLVYLVFILFKKETDIKEERAYFIFSGLKKLSLWLFKDKIKNDLHLLKEEKVSLLFFLVKIYFAPVMFGFLIGNVSSFMRFFSDISVLYNSVSIMGLKQTFLSVIFPTLFYLILVLDTLIFAFGYVVESKSLKSVVRSVEPTAFGWIVAIMCYPPINNITADLLGWYSSDFANFGNINLNLAMGFISISLFIIYVWASVALGFKASNLTNRGIVSKGPYKYIRHPAYISKNLSWWVMAIPLIKISGFIAIFSLVAWSLIYYLRAVTEERHLLQDPDYVEYSKKVKYMFIPGII